MTARISPTTNKIQAISLEITATPPMPSKPATIAMMRKIAAQ